MPKGQTSRPYNRKEKKAVATKKNLKSATKGFSSTNKKTVMGSSKAKAAAKTTAIRKLKAKDREFGKIVGRSSITRQSDSYAFSTDGKGNKPKPKKKTVAKKK